MFQRLRKFEGCGERIKPQGGGEHAKVLNVWKAGGRGGAAPVVEAVCYQDGVVGANRKAKGFPE